MRRPPFCMLAVLAAAGLGGPAATSEACCNALPVVSRDYQSTLGSVRERLAAPGNTVTITRKPCDTLNGVTPPSFDPDPTKNLITIVFNPPGGGGTTVSTVGAWIDQCDKSGTCVACLSTSPFPCNTLRFTMPPTNAQRPPDGASGPATITVIRGTDTVAEIGPLYQPSDQCDCGGGTPSPQCDQQRDGTFEQFTVLPEPNELQALVSGSPLRMTVDGGGNLLVPLHHPTPNPNQSGTADWERGEGAFDAFKPPPPSKKIGEKLAAAPQGNLQAFTISGQRVAPLLEHDDQGGLFGLADVEYSVLRIKREDETANPLYDVVHRMTPGNALVKIPKSGGMFSPDQFDLAVCHLVKLVSLRVAADVVTHVDDQDMVHIHQRAQAGQDCGTLTGIPAKDVTLGAVVDLALEAQGSLVGFLSRGGPTVEAFSAKGKHLTPSKSQAAATAWLVNDHVLAVEDPLVYFYFWDPKDPNYTDPTLRTFDRKTQAFEDVAPARDAAVAGQRAVTRDPNTDLAYAHEGTTHTPLNVTAAHLAIAPDLVAVADLPNGQLNVWPWPANVSAPTVPQQIPVPAVKTDQPLGITNACTGAGCTRVVVNSQVASDHVLRFYAYDPATGTGTVQDTDLKATAVDFVAGERLVAFRTSELAEGKDLNNDGDTVDVVMRLVAFDGLPPLSPRVIETGFPAVGQSDSDVPWEVLGWRTAYQVVGDELFFVTRECNQGGSNKKGCSTGGTDLNGDGDADDLVLQIYQYGNNAVHPLMAVGTAPVQILPFPGGVNVQVAGAAPSSGPAVAQRDVDGVFDARDICATASDAGPLDGGSDGLADHSGDPARGTGLQSPLSTSPGGIAVGDGDGDGVLDAFDNCETIINPRQLDDDRDGLGDRFCDPTYCTTFTPPPIAAPGRLAPYGRPIKQVQAAILGDLQGRSRASLDCLERIANGDPDGDPETLCRGSFVAEVENPPVDPPTRKKVALAERQILALFAGKARECPSDRERQHFKRQILRSLGESVNAATRVAYGEMQYPETQEVRELNEEERAFQANLGKESAHHLETLVAAMGECLSQRAHGSPDAAALCLGRIEAGKLVLPTDPTTAEGVQSANDAVRAATDDHRDGRILARLDTCASDARRELSCPVCTNWRNAVEVLVSLFGPPPAERDVRLAHAAAR